MTQIDSAVPIGMQMDKYLKKLIDRLYKPTTGNRQAIAMSRRYAEQLPLLPSVAIISITAPDRGQAKIAPFPLTLRISFADVDFQNSELSSRAKCKLDLAFNQEHAWQIFAFIESLPAEISSVVVHCEGGYSRSTAVVQALHDLYQFDVDAETLKQANPSIVSLLRKEGLRPKQTRW
ncbi:hypothetical protein [Comamonas testosteroni]|uniref:hypothetical protein n=1 Tax=Comamonas testosteroni TaxID=285 RepID=UPI001E2A486F|nr:hypothetical protein [Comamonas testosteroni]